MNLLMEVSRFFW